MGWTGEQTRSAEAGMAKTDLPFDSGDYAPVAERIALFFERYPLGRIITELVSRTEREITFKATVYRSEAREVSAATGWASERIGDGEVNAVACLENTETSAIGRALANLGFTASQNRPSAEEMAKAARERARLAKSRLTRRARPAHPQGLRARFQPSTARSDASDDSLQEQVSAIVEVLRLLATAMRMGLDAGRAAALRRRLSAGGISPYSVGRVERWLRGWLRDREEGRFPPPQTM